MAKRAPRDFDSSDLALLSCRRMEPDYPLVSSTLRSTCVSVTRVSLGFERFTSPPCYPGQPRVGSVICFSAWIRARADDQLCVSRMMPSWTLTEPSCDTDPQIQSKLVHRFPQFGVFAALQ